MSDPVVPNEKMAEKRGSEKRGSVSQAIKESVGLAKKQDQGRIIVPRSSPDFDKSKPLPYNEGNRITTTRLYSIFLLLRSL